MDLHDLVRQVAASIRDHGTKALLMDDITRLRMHRADDQDMLDLIRAFMGMHVTLVLIGVDIPGSGLLREGRHDPRTGQWAFPPSRHAGVHSWRPPRPSGGSTWSSSTRSATPPRPRSPPGPGTWPASSSSCGCWTPALACSPAATMPEYLFRRTNGVVGLLGRLIEDGCREAIATGTERLDQALLDSVALSLPDTTQPRRRCRRDSPHPARATPRRRQRGREGKRGRNTVFDDRGPAAGTGS